MMAAAAEEVLPVQPAAAKLVVMVELGLTPRQAAAAVDRTEAHQLPAEMLEQARLAALAAMVTQGLVAALVV